MEKNTLEGAQKTLMSQVVKRNGVAVIEEDEEQAMLEEAVLHVKGRLSRKNS